MLDLETMGTQPGSAITAIGAVRFDLTGSQQFDTFYSRIDIKDCIDCGLIIDPGTVIWWLKRSEEARNELIRPAGPLADALRAFSLWLPNEEFEIWGKGPSFDLACLERAYEACDERIPWRFPNERCVRTIAALRPEIAAPPPEIKHHALHDAMSQARHMIAIHQALAGPATTFNAEA